MARGKGNSNPDEKKVITPQQRLTNLFRRIDRISGLGDLSKSEIAAKVEEDVEKYREKRTEYYQTLDPSTKLPDLKKEAKSLMAEIQKSLLA